VEPRFGIGHAKYVGSVSADGYPGSPHFEDEVVQRSYGWYPLSAEWPAGNDDYTQRLISSLIVGVPDVLPYSPGDLVVLPPVPILFDEAVAPMVGENFVVSEDVRDFTTGPWGRGPGGTIVVERVKG
jgi:hypothetical protein